VSSVGCACSTHLHVVPVPEELWHGAAAHHTVQAAHLALWHLHVRRHLAEHGAEVLLTHAAHARVALRGGAATQRTH
jgi:hypothetical protein